MSIDRLMYFATVVETKNLRKAAELSGISPPSMSKAISVLEQELGCKLIHQEGRGIGITPKGIEVYRLSTSLLDEFRRFHEAVKAGEPKSKRLRLATFEVFSSYFMSSFLCAEQGYEILMLEMPPGKLERAVIDGAADVGITYLPSPDRTIEYTEIGSFIMGIYGLKKWEGVPFEEWPFAIPTTELRIHSSEINALDMWPRAAPRRKIRYEFELLETALQTSRQGLSVLHCPEIVVKLHNEQVKPSLQLSLLKPPAGYKAGKATKVYLVTKRGVDSVELERKMAKFMRSIK